MAYLKLDTRRLFPKVRVGLVDLLGDLEPEEWDQPTVCEGWNVKDVTLHLLGVDIGTISRGRDGVTMSPDAEVGLAAWLNEFNEEWVQAARRLSPRLLRELLNITGEMFERHLETVELDAVTAHVSWASDDPVPVWLDIAREYTERWVHQQQIRDATGRPGLREAEFMAPVLQTFVHALPKTYKDVDAAEGTAVQLQANGPGGGIWHVRLSGSEWHLEAGKHPDPDTAVTMDEDSAWRVFTRDPHGRPPEIEGDETLGRHVVDAVAIIA